MVHTLYTSTVALPPTIPTSFVPKQPVAPQTRRPRPQAGVLYYAALFILAVMVVGAGLTFAYSLYLNNVRDSRQARLHTAEQGINNDTVTSFIQLRNRIQTANVILNQRIRVSQFFDVLETLTLQNVRFKTLTFSVGNDRSAKITMSGSARSFNALAVESSAFAHNENFKRAIFSGIAADKSGVVSFTLNAELAPKLLLDTVKAAQAQATAPAAANIATTTPFVAATTTTTTTTAAPATTTPKKVTP